MMGMVDSCPQECRTRPKELTISRELMNGMLEEGKSSLVTRVVKYAPKVSLLHPTHSSIKLVNKEMFRFKHNRSCNSHSEERFKWVEEGI